MPINIINNNNNNIIIIETRILLNYYENHARHNLPGT